MSSIVPHRIHVDKNDATGTVEGNTESTSLELHIRDHPREQRRSRNRLMVLAIASRIAQLLSVLCR